MHAMETPSLPLGSYSNKATYGGVDLRVAARQRKYLVAGAAVLAILAGWRTFVNWQIAPSGSVAPWFVLVPLNAFVYGPFGLVLGAILARSAKF